ncbi:MAG: hypothetical protein A2Y57_03105 [Candidatus Woykebacteria bacterium RBG_13_40_7b]|uniref:Restriction endonuclease type IV Mrr domain-containing protein n=1 Tax=Candidatus Woykebacteria bacterium RBG_13_40_7b TaxID=1802594 RepID=A0A1G1W8G3_9BACT|nr:MAG: hypothetical protein A2Y57_03105 [Candidatus Woykebacteria bacterium RBG_13_40_7b]
MNVLKQNPSQINVRFLKQYSELKEFIKSSKKGNEIVNLPDETIEKQTPEESLEYGYSKIKQTLMQELLNQIKESSPSFFEKLVVELLVKMGYGGSRKDAGKSIGRSGDGGIDGIIKEDRLGLDVIYIQAKKWEANIGRPEIQKFVGALEGKRAKKGVFITTSIFSKEAIDYVKAIDKKVILINGEQLAQLMIDCDIGVSKIASYDIKKIDFDYFSD